MNAKLWATFLAIALTASAILLYTIGLKPATPIYRIGFGDSPPYHFPGDDGRARGLIVDLIDQAAQLQGIHLQWVHQAGGSEEALRTSRVDLWPIVSLRPDRMKLLYVSEPYSENDRLILVRSNSPYRNIRDLRNAAIGYHGALRTIDFLRSQLPSAHFPPFSTNQSVFEALCQGRVEAAYLGEDTLFEILPSGAGCGTSLRAIKHSGMRTQLGVGSTFAAARVADSLRSGIGTLAVQGRLQQIFDWWGAFSTRDVDLAERLARAHRRESWALAGFLATGVFLLISILQSLRLRRERDVSRSTERALQDAELKFSFVVDNLTEMVFGYDMNRRLISANSAVERFFGVAPEQLAMETMIDCIHPDDRARMLEIWNRAFRGETLTRERYRATDKVGKWSWLSGSFTPMLNWAGVQNGVGVCVRDVTERVLAEQALSLSEERYRAFVRNSSEAILRVEIEPPISTDLPVDDQVTAFFQKAIVAQANEAAASMFGYPSAEALTGVLVRKLTPPDDPPIPEIARKFAQAGYRHKNVERMLNHREHGPFPVLLNATAIVEDGRFRRIWMAAADISERKRMEEALRESEERLRILFEAAPDGWYLRRENYEFVECNRALEELLAYSRQEMLGVNMFDLLTHDGLQRAQQYRGKNMVGPAEVEFRRKDGRVAAVELRTFPVVLKGENYVLGCVRDISERRAAAVQIRESEERFRQIAENSSEIFWLEDRVTGRVIYVNQAYESIMGRPAQELLEDPGMWVRQVHPEDLDIAKAASGDVLEHPGRTVEYRIVRPDGGIRWISRRVAPVFDGRGEAYRAAGILADITRLKEREQELRALKAQVERENIQLREVIQSERQHPGIVGDSPAMRTVKAEIETVAPTAATVLVTGETGTGKELVARSIHELSGLKDKPLITVNCAALSTTLIESEFFGHEKGAFTGAVSRKRGRFELADGATIFLDEIGELPLDIQAKLLRVLQDGVFERVGGTQTLKCRVRVIAATNRNLREAVEAKTFRADLFYRLDVFPIRVPPLRDRRMDIPALVAHFLAMCSRSLGKPLSAVTARSMDALMGHEWPGNVRELQHVLERAAIRARGPVVDVTDLLASQPEVPETGPLLDTLDDVERAYFLKVLTETGWVIEGQRGAAQRVGMHPNTLRHRLKKLRVERPATVGEQKSSRRSGTGADRD